MKNMNQKRNNHMKDYDKEIKKDKNDYIPYDDEEYFEQKDTNELKKSNFKYKPTYNKENPYY